MQAKEDAMGEGDNKEKQVQNEIEAAGKDQVT
jgi:hypothetical protein